MLALALPVAGCGGEDEELDVKEGEPVKADHVTYNVVISRFLNPDDTEDECYVVGQPEPPPGQEYFGVFVQLKNDGDEDITVPEAFRVVDTLDNSFDPLPSDSPYALPPGETLEPNRELPEANTIAQDGPTQGSLVPSWSRSPRPRTGRSCSRSRCPGQGRGHRARHLRADPVGRRATQVALLAAAAAALVILVSLFGDVVDIGCLAVIALATLLTAPARREPGGGWWTLLGVGAAASIAGAALAQATATVGGLIAVIGGALVVVAAAIGFPE